MGPRDDGQVREGGDLGKGRRVAWWKVPGGSIQCRPSARYHVQGTLLSRGSMETSGSPLGIRLTTYVGDQGFIDGSST